METDLTGQLLIAMPEMGDPRFFRSVIFVCAHASDGAMGLILNKPMAGLRFSKLAEQLDISVGDGLRDMQVMLGGPVEESRGFVLHTRDFEAGETTLSVTDRIGLTSTLDVLQELATGGGPEKALLALGYSGWGPGQLEQELAENAWLTAPADELLVFGRAYEHKWTAALKSIGVDPLLLSSEAGSA